MKGFIYEGVDFMTSKRILALLLAVMMIFTAIPFSASAAEIASSTVISDIFTDGLFATHIAGKLGKAASDTVTQDDLDTITSVNPSGAVHSVEGIQYLRNLEEARLDNLQLTDRFPDEFVNEMQPNLRFYIANNQRYTSETIYLSSASLGEVYPHIPPLFFQHVQYSQGKRVGTWYLLNQYNGVIATEPAYNGSELSQLMGVSDGNRYTLRLVQDFGNSWMGLNGSQYEFPIQFDTSSNPGVVEGTVTKKGTSPKEPIAGAKITLYSTPQYTSVTDSSGHYKFASVKPGNYKITCEYNGYTTEIKQANVSAKKTTTVDFELGEDNKSSIKGKVIDAVTKEPIEGAEIVPTGTPSGTVYTTKSSDVNGEFIYQNIPAGSYSVVTSKAGYKSDTRTITIEAGVSDEVVIELGGLANIQCQVYDFDAPLVPIEEAVVNLYDASGELVETGDTDALGEVWFRDLPYSTYTVTATKVGYSREEAEIAIVASGDVQQKLYLKADPGEVNISASYDYSGSSADGQPVPDVKLTIQDLDGVHAGSQHKQVGETDEAGEYSFIMATTHTYTLSVEKLGYDAEIVSVNGTPVAPAATVELPQLNPNDEITVEVKVTPKFGAITGTVYEFDTTDEIDGALVEIEALSQDTLPYAGQTSVTVGADGIYKFENVPYGEYEVTAGKNPEFSTELANIEVSDVTTAGGDIVQDFYLHRNPALLVGKVYYFGSTDPVPNAKAYLKDSDGDIRIDKTNVNGIVSAYLNAGEYSAWVEYNGFTTEVQTTDLTSGGEDELIFYVFREDANSLSGLVTDYVTRIPINDFEIELTPDVGTSFIKSGGLYDAYNILEGSYTLTVSADGYYTQSQTVVITNTGVTYANFRLIPYLAEIAGVVKHENGDVIVGATMTLTGDGVNETTQTNASGEYDFALLPTGEYDVKCTTVEENQQKHTDAVGGAITVVDFVLDDLPGTIKGKVSGENAVGISGVKISVYPKDGDDPVTTTTDGNGEYTVSNLPADNYYVAAAKDGYIAQVKSAAVTVGNDTIVNFTLLEEAAVPGILTGKVTRQTATGAPVAGATIEIAEAATPDVIVDTLTTDANGEYWIQLLEEDYTVKMTYQTTVESKEVTVESTLTTIANFIIPNSGGGSQNPNVTFHAGELGTIVGTGSFTVEKGKTVPAEMIPEVETDDLFLYWSLSPQTDDILRPEKVDVSKHVINEDTVFYAVYAHLGEHKAYIKGFPDGKFHALNAITRAEAASIIARACYSDFVEGERYDIGEGYDDPNIENHWAISAIEFCTMKGIFGGYEGKYFYPNKHISREEFAVAFARVGETEVSGELPFTDKTDISSWAENGVYTAYSNGWISGYPDGSFKPQKEINRAEAVKIVNAFLKRGVDEIGVGKLNSKTWSDVSKTYWAYYEIAEASNSHSYYYRDGYKPMENWTKIN